MDKQLHLAALSAQQNTVMRKTLVCVTNQFECQRIIRSGRVIADITHTELVVMSVTSPEYVQNPQALQYLYDVSKENGATMTVTYSENPAKIIGSYIKGNRVVNMLSGMPSDGSSILYRIWNKFNHVNFFAVTEQGEVREVGRAERSA